METILNNIVAKENDNKFEENLFVKNIIVNKNKFEVPTLPIFQLKDGWNN